MWEYPAYLINFQLKCHIFSVILEVAFEIFHTNQELVLYNPHFKHNIYKSYELSPSRFFKFLISLQ